ncbi:MAG TPA: hypothetical protein VMK42_12940 [Anaeromyxobacteraceae bacterium]|nr:hypothetical protein [Anaeromyxobacteraceae bacterium]
MPIRRVLISGLFATFLAACHTTTIPTPVVGTGFISVAVGGLHTVVVKNDGSLWTWGQNYFGQVGNETTMDQPTPLQIAAGTIPWVSAAAGQYYSLALRADDTLWAWGDNFYGELGDGTTTPRNIPVQVAIAAPSSTISAGGTPLGGAHTVALQTNGSLWAWGDNTYGELGDGTTTSQRAPEQIGTATYIAVAAGGFHTAALQSDGTLWAWGYNASGQLGDGTTTSQSVPEQIGTDTYAAVAAGGFHTLALKADGTLWAFGDNTYGQLGDGTTTQRNAPVEVQSGSGYTFTAVAAGLYHTVALDSAGTLWTWGWNVDGQLGNGQTTSADIPQGIAVAFIDLLGAGNLHTVATRYDGSLWAWGSNTFGQLGNTNRTNQPTPLQVQ